VSCDIREILLLRLFAWEFLGVSLGAVCRLCHTLNGRRGAVSRAWRTVHCLRKNRTIPRQGRLMKLKNHENYRDVICEQPLRVLFDIEISYKILTFKITKEISNKYFTDTKSYLNNHIAIVAIPFHGFPLSRHSIDSNPISSSEIMCLSDSYSGWINLRIECWHLWRSFQRKFLWVTCSIVIRQSSFSWKSSLNLHKTNFTSRWSKTNKQCFISLQGITA
jgi:hypothetical protein